MELWGFFYHAKRPAQLKSLFEWHWHRLALPDRSQLPLSLQLRGDHRQWLRDRRVLMRLSVSQWSPISKKAAIKNYFYTRYPFVIKHETNTATMRFHGPKYEYNHKVSDLMYQLSVFGLHLLWYETFDHDRTDYIMYYVIFKFIVKNFDWSSVPDIIFK